MELQNIPVEPTSHNPLKQDSLKQGSVFAPYVSSDEAGFSIAMHVDGIHCAKCINAIERVLTDEPHVTAARVNMSTARLVIHWTGTPDEADRWHGLVEGLGYKARPIGVSPAEGEAEDARLLRYLAVSGFAMGNIMLISVGLWSSSLEVMGMATRELMHWLSGLIALPVVAYAGQPFFISAFKALRGGHTNMDVPISLALILASAMSVFETVTGGEHAYFDSAVMLMFFLLIGRWLDAKARGKVREHARELLSLLEGTATVIREGRQEQVAIQELQTGDHVLIAVGEKVPSDVRVISGESDIDTSLVTGESAPKYVRAGDVLYGGTLNMSQALTCEVLKPSDDSLLADVIRLMEKAEQGRAFYVRLADRAAELYTPVVHSVALLAFLGWYLIGGLVWQDALLIAITTLIITCPCALGLAVPAVQVLAVEWLMKRGVLVKAGDALERLALITHVIMDKTGTLTMGQPQVVAVTGDELAVQMAASLAAHSRHPFSQAISQYYTGALLPVTDIREVAGQGVYAQIEGHQAYLGKPRDTDQGDAPALAGAEPPSVVFWRDDAPAAAFVMRDPLRPEARETIAAFHKNHIQTALVSGDRHTIVAPIAQDLGFDHFEADILPQDKLGYIRQLQDGDAQCLMVGDGLNDAPALAQANISISPASGMDITQNTADIVFQGQSLSAVNASWQMARYSTRLVKQNFALAIIYNLIAIPIALMGWVTPLIAAIAMSGSSLLVVGNAFRIRLYSEK